MKGTIKVILLIVGAFGGLALVVAAIQKVMNRGEVG